MMAFLYIFMWLCPKQSAGQSSAYLSGRERAFVFLGQRMTEILAVMNVLNLFFLIYNVFSDDCLRRISGIVVF